MFLRKGNTYRPTDAAQLDLHQRLPATNYQVEFDQMIGFYLEQVSEFPDPGKLYGNLVQRRDRILSTFEQRDASTGVLLMGEKGSGKTLMAKELAREGARRGVPTILVAAPFKGPNFNSFIQMINQPAILLIDEFEKTYDSDDQQALLTLLDGSMPTKKMFVLTINDQFKIDHHMKNRPGRLFYSIAYKGLDAQFITEYCEDRLDNKRYIDGVLRISTMFENFNFDQLKALVEEMNRYDEPPAQAIELLNIRPYGEDRRHYDVQLQPAAAQGKPTNAPQSWRCNPLMDRVPLAWVYKLKPDQKNVDDDNWFDSTDEAGEELPGGTCVFDPSDCLRADVRNGEYSYQNKDGDRLVLKEHRSKEFDFFSAF